MNKSISQFLGSLPDAPLFTNRRTFPRISAVCTSLAGVLFVGKVSIQHHAILPSWIELSFLALFIFLSYSWTFLSSHLRWPLTIASFCLAEWQYTWESTLMLGIVGTIFLLYTGVRWKSIQVEALRKKVFLKPVLILICWICILYGLKLTEGDVAFSELNFHFLLSDILLVLALSFISDFQDREQDFQDNVKTLANQLSLQHSALLILGLLSLRLFLCVEMKSVLLACITLLYVYFFFRFKDAGKTTWYMDGLIFLECFPFYWG